MIDIREFRAMRWQVDPAAAGAAYATVAHNVWRRNSAFEPLLAGARMESVPNNDWRFARTFFRHDERFIASSSRRDLEGTQVVGDLARRLYAIGDSGLLLQLPKHEIPTGYPTDFSGGHRVGVPAVPNYHTQEEIDALPEDILDWEYFQRGLSADSTHMETLSDPEHIGRTKDTAFLATFVNKYGEEGPPCQATDGGVYLPGSTRYRLRIRYIENHPDIVGMRVYMAHEGAFYRISSPDLTYPGTEHTAPVPGLSWLISNPNDPNPSDGEPEALIRIIADPAGLQEALVSADWDSPPTGLKHMAALAGGVLAVADDHSVYTSVPYHWHAFPPANTYPVDGTIKRLVRTSGGLAVLTDRGVSFLAVSGDGQLIEIADRLPHAIGDSASLEVVDGGHAFVSGDGVVVIGATGGRVATDGWIDRESWLERVSIDKCRTGFYDGRLLLATRNPASGQPIGYALNLGAQEATSFEVTEDTLKSGFWRDPETGETGYVRNSSSLSVFNRGSPYEGVWESGDIEIPGSTPLNTLSAEVEDGGEISVTITPEYRGDPTPTVFSGRRPVRMRSTGRSGSLRARVVCSRIVSRLVLTSGMRRAA